MLDGVGPKRPPMLPQTDPWLKTASIISPQYISSRFRLFLVFPGLLPLCLGSPLFIHNPRLRSASSFPLSSNAVDFLCDGASLPLILLHCRHGFHAGSRVVFEPAEKVQVCCLRHFLLGWLISARLVFLGEQSGMSPKQIHVDRRRPRVNCPGSNLFI